MSDPRREAPDASLLRILRAHLGRDPAVRESLKRVAKKPTYEDYVTRKSREGGQVLPRDMWERYVFGGPQGQEEKQQPETKEPGEKPERLPKPLFSASETRGLPKWAAQADSDPVKIFESAKAAYPLMLDWLDRGEGVDKMLGAKVVRRDRDPDAPVDLDRPGPLMVIAPNKDRREAQRKVDERYSGDWREGAVDLVRATIAVDTYDQLPEVIEKLKESGLELASRPRNRFRKPTFSGYRDVVLNARLPNGHVMEIQLHLKEVLKAKEEAHEEYRRIKGLNDQIKKRGRGRKDDVTPEQLRVFEAATRRMKALYDDAWRRVSAPSPMSIFDVPSEEELDLFKTASRITYYEMDGLPVRWDRARLPEIVGTGGPYPVDSLVVFAERGVPIDEAAFKELVTERRKRKHGDKKAFGARFRRLYASHPELRAALKEALLRGARGHLKEAAFSIFDPPEEIAKAVAAEKAKAAEKAEKAEAEKAKAEKAKAEAEKAEKAKAEAEKAKAEKADGAKPAEKADGDGASADGKWEEFLKLFYEGGKKKVKNPNPKTKDKYPEVQVSTALKDAVFAGKVKKEYEAWLAQGEPEKADDAPDVSEPEKPKKELKIGDKLENADQLKPGMFIENKDGVVGEILSLTEEGDFRYKTWKAHEWGPTQILTKKQADQYFSGKHFTVSSDPVAAFPDGSKPAAIEDVDPGDFVWFNGDRRRVKKVEPDPHKYGLRVQLEDGTWVNQTLLDQPKSSNNGFYVYVEKGEGPGAQSDEEPSKESEKPEGKAQVGDVVTKPSQLKVDDWIQSHDAAEPDNPYIGKVVEISADGTVMVQDFSATLGKFLGKPSPLTEAELAKVPAKKIEAPKKVKKPLSGKPVTDLKKLKPYDVLRIHDYATGKTFTAQVWNLQGSGAVALKIVDPKTGKIKDTMLIKPEDFDDYQVHRLPKSKVPKALQPPEDESDEKTSEPPEKKEPEKKEPEKKEPEKKEPEKKEPEKTTTKAVKSDKWKLQTHHVSFEEIKPGDMIHTTSYGPQRVDSVTSTGVRLDSGIVLPKSKLQKEKTKYVVSRGDKPQKETPPKAPERPSGHAVTSADQVKEGDVIEYEHNGVTYRGEVISWDTPGEKFRVRIIYPPEKLPKYESYDAATGEMKYKTPSFDFEKIKKRKPRILTKEEMKNYDAEVKKYTERLKDIDKKYSEDVAEYEAAMAGKKEVTTGPLKNVRPPKAWNHGSTIARDADRFFEQYKEILGPKIESIVAQMSPGQEYWTGNPKMWAEMSEGERKLAQSGHLPADEFKKLLTSDEWSAWSSALASWQGSSGGGPAHKLMGGLENLGVEGGPKYFESANVQHYREEGRNSEALQRAISKAMAFSQLVYDALGLEHVTLYRGTRTKPVVGAPQGKKLQTSTARELASFSIDPSVAYRFAGSGGENRVVRYKVPVSRLFVSPVTYANLSTPVGAYDENEYVVAGQDGMEGKVMPQSPSQFDPEAMKLASGDEVLMIEFSQAEDDWLRPGIIEKWWHANPLDSSMRLLKLAREHSGFRRELLAALAPRRASFSIFDAPEDIEREMKQRKAPPSGGGDADFREWFDQRYEGGKKRVSNPNPKTKERYPDVAASTAMKDQTFAAKVYAEYQQQAKSQEAAPAQKQQKKDEDKPEKPVNERVHEWGDRFKTLLERIKEGASAAEKDAKEFKDELGQYLVDNYKKLSTEDFARVQKMMAGIDLAMIGGAMGEMTRSNSQVKKTVAEWSDKIDAARETKDPKKLRKVVEDAVAFLNERMDPKKFNPTLFKGLFDKLQTIGPSEIEEAQAPEAKKEPEAKPEEKGGEKHLDIDAGGFTQVGPQSGSNPGGLYESEDGTRYYVKTPKTEDRARNEILAGKLYELAGIDVPEIVPATRDGKFSVASKIIPGLKRNKSKLTKGGVPGVAEGIAVDAWLANWDVVGLEHDNLLVDEEGHGKRVDTGGALRYRAMGDPKGDSFGPEVTELDVFTDKSRRAGGVLGHATPEQIVESIDRVLAIPELKIRGLVHAWGPKDEKESVKLLETLLARRESLRKQRDKYAEQAKKASRTADHGFRVAKGDDMKMNPTTKSLLRFAASDPGFRRALATQLRSIAPRDFTVSPEAQQAMLRGLREGDVVRVTCGHDQPDTPEEAVLVTVVSGWDPTIPGVEAERDGGKDALLVDGGPIEGVLYQATRSGPGRSVRRLALVHSPLVTEGPQ